MVPFGHLKIIPIHQRVSDDKFEAYYDNKHNIMMKLMRYSSILIQDINVLFSRYNIGIILSAINGIILSAIEIYFLPAYFFKNAEDSSFTQIFV